MSFPSDGNAWYQISETRVDFNSSMQLTGTDLLFAAAADTTASQYWQILDIGNGQYALRNEADGIRMQLGTCYDAKELDASKTKPCMVASDPTDSQKWTISNWGDGTYKIQNVGNGTNYNLDWHPGNPGFMSSTTAAVPKQPAQHWEFASRKAINDGAFSTTFTTQPGAATATQTGTNKGTSTASSDSSSTSSTSQKSSSTGTAVGVGVGVGVAVAVLICFAVFFLLRRRRQQQQQQQQQQRHPAEMDSHTPALPGYEVAGSEAKKQHLPLHHEMYTPPAELPAEGVGPYELHAPYKRPS